MRCIFATIVAVEVLHIPQVCVCSLIVQHAMRMLHTTICDLSGSTVFFHIITSMAGYLKKKTFLQIKCVLILFTTFV